MLTTVWPQVVDALVTQMRSATGYRGPGDTKDGVLVLDGVEQGLTSDPGRQHLVIGYPGDPDLPESMGSSSQTPGPFATTRPKDENGTIDCRAVAWTGDADLSTALAQGTAKTVRDQAYAIVAAVESLCRTDPKLAAAVPGLQWAFVQAQNPLQYLGNGITCEVPFTVVYFARLS